MLQDWDATVQTLFQKLSFIIFASCGRMGTTSLAWGRVKEYGEVEASGHLACTETCRLSSSCPGLFR